PLEGIEDLEGLRRKFPGNFVPGVKAKLDLRLICEADPRVGHRLSGPTSQPFPPAGTLKVDWRPFRIEVTPEVIRAAWGEEPLQDLTAEQLAVFSRAVLKANPPLNAALPLRDSGDKIEFPPRGGLGLLIYNGSASFRNVVVEPLNQEP